MFNRILVLLFILFYVPTLNALESDTNIMRVAVFTTLGSFALMYMQDENDFTTPLHHDFTQPTLTLYKGQEIGQSDRRLKNLKISLSYKWNKNIYENKNFNLSGYTEIYIDRYSSSLEKSLHSKGYIYALVPTFEYKIKKINFFQIIPYFQTGVGFALLDNTIVENREKSTHFQFSDNIGFGLEYKNLHFGYKFTHISNLGIKMPNPGLDFHQLELSYTFL